MTKYRVTEVVDTQPGKCANCGASRTDGRKYIEFGVHVEFYGDVIFCSLCIGDMARTLGLFRALEIHIIQLEETIKGLKGRQDLGDELKKTVLLTYEQVKEYFGGITDNPGDSNSNVTTSDKLSTDEGTVVSSDSESDKSGSKKPELRTTQQVTKPRSTNVPSLAELIDTHKK